MMISDAEGLTKVCHIAKVIPYNTAGLMFNQQSKMNRKHLFVVDEKTFIFESMSEIDESFYFTAQYSVVIKPRVTDF